MASLMNRVYVPPTGLSTHLTTAEGPSEEGLSLHTFELLGILLSSNAIFHHLPNVPVTHALILLSLTANPFGAG